MIRRSIARDKPRVMPKRSKDELEKQKRQFTSTEIWNAKKPNDFNGTAIEYLIYMKEEEKQKKAIKDGTSTLQERRK